MLTLAVLLLCSASCFAACAKGESVRRDFLNGMFGTERGRRGSLCAQEEPPWLKCSPRNLWRVSGDEVTASHGNPKMNER